MKQAIMKKMFQIMKQLSSSFSFGLDYKSCASISSIGNSDISLECSAAILSAVALELSATALEFSAAVEKLPAGALELSAASLELLEAG